ncbi:MAG: DsrE family protein [Deltaproteobacteria bacterium]|nr:DsrE family protein [Deltaproteobacteria bacterium]
MLKSIAQKRSLASLASVLVAILLALPLGSAFAQTAAQEPQKVFMKLDHGTDDLHAALMALKISEGLVSKGAKVTLFLNLEAVRLADKRQPLDLKWGLDGGHSAQHLLESFVKKGGAVLVCPMCAKNAGITAKELRTGAKIATSIDEINEAFLASDKSMDY